MFPELYRATGMSGQIPGSIDTLGAGAFKNSFGPLGAVEQFVLIFFGQIFSNATAIGKPAAQRVLGLYHDPYGSVAFEEAVKPEHIKGKDLVKHIRYGHIGHHVRGKGPHHHSQPPDQEPETDPFLPSVSRKARVYHCIHDCEHESIDDLKHKAVPHLALDLRGILRSKAEHLCSHQAPNHAQYSIEH